MKNYKFIILIKILLPFVVIGQDDTLIVNDSTSHNYFIKKDLTLITGYQIQNNHFAEIGIGIIEDGVKGYHPSTLIYGISNELKLAKDFIWGLKASLWMGGGSAGMNVGLNLINYTDFNESSLRFRPEIGIGFGIFRIVYGYNFAITNKAFYGINKHNFGLNIMLKLKKHIQNNKINTKNPKLKNEKKHL